MHPSRLVEAAGVEPASGKDRRGTSTCIAPSARLAGRPPKGQMSGRQARLSFAFGSRARAVTLCRCSGRSDAHGQARPARGLPAESNPSGAETCGQLF